MNDREQIPLTPELVDAVLAAVAKKGVLVGGQALAIWISIFELTAYQAGSAPISIDADFLGDRDLVTQINTNIPGSTAKYQLRSAISCLIGVVEIPLAGDQFMSVDIIDSVPPLTEEHVFARAILLATPEDKSFLVLHPVDLLTSRAYNLRHFKEKQNANGIEQLRMSLLVVHAYLCASTLMYRLRKAKCLMIFVLRKHYQQLNIYIKKARQLSSLLILVMMAKKV